MGEWKVVFCTASPQEGELVRSMLENHGIHAVIMDQRSSPYPPVGDTGVLVPQDDVVRALHLLQKHREA